MHSTFGDLSADVSLRVHSLRVNSRGVRARSKAQSMRVICKQILGAKSTGLNRLGNLMRAEGQQSQFAGAVHDRWPWRRPRRSGQRRRSNTTEQRSWALVEA